MRHWCALLAMAAGALLISSRKGSAGVRSFSLNLSDGCAGQAYVLLPSGIHTDDRARGGRGRAFLRGTGAPRCAISELKPTQQPTAEEGKLGAPFQGKVRRRCALARMIVSTARTRC